MSFQATKEPPPGIDYLADLANNPRKLRRWLHDCAVEVRQPFTHAMLLIGALRQETGLSVAALLDELRCRRRSAHSLSFPTPAHLEPCVAFLRWVLTETLRAPEDKKVRCAVVGAASTLYADSRGSLEECAAALVVPIGQGESFTPTDLIELGEVEPAFRMARRALFGAFEPVSSLDDGHLRSRPAVHIAPTTFYELLRYSNGPYQGMAVGRALVLLRHVRLCGPCKDAYAAAAEVSGLDPAEVRVVDC